MAAANFLNNGDLIKDHQDHQDLRVIVFLVDHVHLGPRREIHVVVRPLQAWHILLATRSISKVSKVHCRG